MTLRLSRAQERQMRSDIDRLKRVFLVNRDPREAVWRNDPAAWAKEKCGLELDPWQEEVIRAHGHTLILGPRQCGKSTVCAVLAAHVALYGRQDRHSFSPPEILLVAKAERQAKQLLKRTKTLLRLAGEEPIAAGMAHVKLSTGAEILALPGASPETVRGYSPDLLVTDEAAWIETELFASVLPSLSVSRGRFVALSTSGPASGFYYDSWTGTDPNYTRIRVTIDDIPRYDAKILEAERLRLGELYYGAEYLGKFIESGLLPIDLAAARDSVDEEVDIMDIGI